MEVNEEMIVTREDFKEPKEELPPFNSPLLLLPQKVQLILKMK